MNPLPGRRHLALLALVAVSLSACASGSIATLPSPPTTSAAASTTSLPDTGGAYLDQVSGVSTTTTAALGPGASTLAGTVMGPSGPVPNAVVQVQRITAPGSPPATDEIASLADGTWRLAGILGGVYRIRAWRAPDLALTTPVTVFLSAGETRQVQMQIQQYSGQVISSSLAPRPPVVDQPSNLVVQVTNTSVGNDGVVRAVPVVGATIYLSGSDAWSVNGANPTTTDANGQAGWQITCTSTGSQPLTVTVDNAQVQTLGSVGSCVAPTPTTTTTSSPSSSTSTSL